MEGDYQEQDRRFAEWYVWAKREVSTDGKVCLGAAQAAMEAFEDGGDDPAARTAARRSVAGHGIALVSRIAPRRRAYAEWYDWARREIGGPKDRLHVAAATALERLDSGGDVGQAAGAARAAIQPPPAVPPPPAGPPAPVTAPAQVPAQVAGPPVQAPPYAPQQPAYAPQQPAYAPQQPAHAPQQPAHAPQQPADTPPYAPQQPVHTPQQPQQPAHAAPYGGYPAYAPRPLPPSAPQHAYAGFWLRAAAALIDGVLLAIGLAVVLVVILFVTVVGLFSSGQDVTDNSVTALLLAVLVIATVLTWLYFAGLESSGWQGTVGKRLMRLVVTDEFGARIAFGRATGRYFGKIVSALVLFVGYVMAAFTERKQALHDLMASTLVVRRQHLALLTPPPPAPPAPPAPHAAAGEVQGA